MEDQKKKEIHTDEQKDEVKPKKVNRQHEKSLLVSKDKFQKRHLANKLRATPNQVQQRLKKGLDRRRMNYSFRVVVHGYIPEFVFRKKHIVELDWGHACNVERIMALESHGYQVMRIPVGRVMGNVEGVVDDILEFVGNGCIRRTEKPRRVKLPPDESLRKFFHATEGI